MGWLLFNNINTKEDLIKEITKSEQYEKHCSNGETIIATRTIIAKTTRGNKLWTVEEFEDEQECGIITGQRLIGLYLLSTGKRGYGYKYIDESCGPAYYDCPLKYLDMAGDPIGEYSKKWREQVKEYHQEQKTKNSTIKNIEVGDILELVDGLTVDKVFVFQKKPLIGQSKDGLMYKISKRHIRNLIKQT